MTMTSCRQCPGGGVLVNVQGGALVNFMGADDVTRAMSKGSGACECLHPPPPSGNPVSTPEELLQLRYPSPKSSF